MAIERLLGLIAPEVRAAGELAQCLLGQPRKQRTAREEQQQRLVRKGGLSRAETQNPAPASALLAQRRAVKTSPFHQ